jgi:beta-glucosidase/6-phospho-beta-glucosidase/beta-galactosidase
VAANASIFPTFFLSGFECSTFVWKDQGRRDLAAETRHREHAQEDYAFLRHLGIGVAREGAPWPLIHRGRGRYDFAPIEPLIEAMHAQHVLPIWDLCHYGYPDELDPFGADFAPRFADYAQAVAEHVIPRLPEPHFFTPINEITFFAFAAGEWGWAAPFGRTRQERFDLRRRLCEADIAAVNAIRAVSSAARMVHIDPLVNVVAPKDRPDLAAAAWRETYDDTFLAWDMIAGHRHPELGGAPDILDIIGVNCYSFGQMEYREHGPHAALPPGDDRIVPLCELLLFAYERYRRPMIVGETSGLETGRAAWLRDVVQETLAAVDRGVDLHGVCLFPAVDMPDWHKGIWVHNGLADLVEDAGDLRRNPVWTYCAELRRWQRRLKRVTRLDSDPLSDPVNLQDVRDAARAWKVQPDANWS